jgi:phage protein D/phage baseplate assembly protein gpV
MDKYFPTPFVEIEGISEEKEKENLGNDLLSLTVEESLHLPTAFTLILHHSFASGNPDADLHWDTPHALNALKPGTGIKLGFYRATSPARTFRSNNNVVADNKKAESMFEGEITGVDVRYGNSHEASIVVKGYDLSHRLHMGRHNRSFLNMTDSDIATKIIKEVGIPIGEIEDAGIVHEYVFQENETNFVFLQSRAARLGFEMYIGNSKTQPDVKETKFYFRKSQPGSPVELEWNRNLFSFHNRNTTHEQVDSVKVSAYSVERKERIEAEVKKENAEVVTKTGNNKGSENAALINVPKVKTVVDQNIQTQGEADKLAQTIFNELSSQFMLADGLAEGDPDIRPGKIVKIEKMGEKQDGEYYITDATHHYEGRSYTTEFSVRGSRGGNLATSIGNRPKLKPGQTNLVGLVTNNKDPKGWGRVKVKFPTLTEEHESNWARVVGAGAGPDRGFWCLPEVDDEVLCCFEHGDIHRPYVIGGVWNGKDAPPDSQDESVNPVHLRTFATRKGHRMTYADETAGSWKQGIHIVSSSGYKIVIDEESQYLEILTPGGHHLKMDDAGKSVTLKSSGSMNIEAATSLTMKAQASMEINATGQMTIKSATKQIN